MKYVITVFFSCLFLVGITQLRTSEEVFLVPQKYISRDASLDNQPALEITVVDDADWFLKYVKNAWKDTKGLSMSRTKTGWASDPLIFNSISSEKVQFLFDTKKESGKELLLIQLRLDQDKKVFALTEEPWVKLKSEIQSLYTAYLKDRYEELLDKVQKDYSLSNGALTKLKESIDKQNAKILDAQKTIDQKNQEVKEQEKKRQEQEAVLSELEKVVQGIEDEIKPVEKEKEENEKLLREVNERKAELIANGDGEGRKMKKAIKEEAKINDELTDLQKNIEKLELKKRSAKDKVNSQKDKVREFKNQEDKAQDKVREAEKTRSELEKKKKDAESEAQDEADKLRVLGEQITKLTSAMSVL
jgi:chromosome segregation ATPase